MMDERQKLEAAIAALQAQRAVLGDAVVESALGPLHERLRQLSSPPPATPHEQARRQVSVLFLDVVGSTALSERLDPEDVHAVMDGMLERCTTVVQAHGGRVLQYAGDNLLAAFGADQAREDDAERAVRCGLALLDEGVALRERVRLEHGHDQCHVRVGIHTGSVLLGGGVDEDGTIRGLTVNIAARMEQAAPAGTLRISHDTWALVRGLFEAQRQAPLHVKGRDEPLVTYLVQRALPRSFRSRSRGIDGLLPDMVGREAEFAWLSAMLDEVVALRSLRAATLVGEPGIGKTRLLDELQRTLPARAPDAWLLLGRAHPGSRLQPYGLLRDLLAWRLQIADSDSLGEAKARLVAGLEPWLGEAGEAKAHRIGQLMGLDFGDSPHVRGLEPPLLRTLAFAALEDYLQALASDGAIGVMLLEDLHWADDGSLDFLDGMLHQEAGLPLLLVATARPELLERRPAWGDGVAVHRLLPLSALDAAQGEHLARSLLSRVAGDADALRLLLIEQAEGNPFYMEELVRMLIDDGVIVVDGPEWRVLPQRLREAQLPTTLVGVLQARLDALPAADRLALQQASIVGHVFWDEALGAIDPQAPSAVPALRGRSLVHQRDSSAFDDTPEQAFHHHLLQQVTYDTVLRPVRRAGHAAAARWLAERVGDRPAEYLAVTAQHYERAGDDAKALEYFERAAEDAVKRFANAAALEYLQRALASPALTNLRQRDRLLYLQQIVADLLGDRALQEASLQQRREVAEALDDDSIRADLLVDEALLASRRSQEAQALASAQRARVLAERSGHAYALAMALGQIAWSLYATEARIDEALDHARRASAVADEALRREPLPKLQTLQVQLLSLRANFEQAAGDFGAMRATLNEALSRAQDYGLRRPQVSILELLGDLESALGRDEPATGHYATCMTLADEIGWVIYRLSSRYNLAMLHGQAGRIGPALDQLAEAEAHAVRSENHSYEGRCLVLKSRLLAARGDGDAAREALDRAAAIFEPLDVPAFLCVVWAEQALLRMAQERLADAVALVERIDAARAAGVSLAATEDPWRPRLACHRVWQAVGDPRAAEAIESLHAELQAAAERAGDAAARHDMLNRHPLNREIVAAWTVSRGPRAAEAR